MIRTKINDESNQRHFEIQSNMNNPTKYRNRFIDSILKILFLSSLLASMNAFAGSDFYYKSTYGRGVGTVLEQFCPSGQNNESGLCYTPARSGYNCNGTNTCVADCPSGYSASGLLTCHYNGTASYSSLSTSSCASRSARSCTKIFGKQICVGGDCLPGIVDNGCRSGYHEVAGVCYIDTPAGFGGSGADPTRPTYNRGAGTVPNLACPSGKENNASLCYTPCRDGYAGIGPVCWSKAPSGFVDCGAGVASSKSSCDFLIADQVLAITIPVLDAAIIAGSAGTITASTSPSAGRAIRLAKALKKLNLRSATDLYGYAKQMKDLLPLMTSYQAVFAPVGQQISNAVPKSVTDVGAILQIGDTFKAIGKALASPQSLALMQQNLQVLSVILGVNLVPSYTGTSTDVAFQIVRDSIGAFNLILAIYENTEGTLITPFALGFAADMSDVLAQYMYTIYGE